MIPATISTCCHNAARSTQLTLVAAGLSENIAKFKEKVKDFNLEDEDEDENVRVYLNSIIGEEFQYQTITNVAPINNLEAAVNL